MKYIAITERNGWERESWTYVFCIENISGGVMRWLQIFIRVANEYFEEAYESAKKDQPWAGKLRGSLFPMPPLPVVVGASKYSMDFYDDYEIKGSRLYLKQDNEGTRSISLEPKYSVSELLLDRQISFRKMKAVAVKMRDKKNNDIYKSFTTLLLSKPVKKIKAA